jgi:TRAP-type C4-dicarboxylate transport system permease small subunit
MKTIHTIASVLIVALGCLHIAVTFFNYHGLSYDAVWFLGTGVGIVLAGFMNIAMLRDGGKDTVIWSMALVTNLFFVLGFAAASYMMREPQVFVGAALFLATTIYSFVVKPRPEI